MKSMTSEMPKCLVALKGRPLLEWQIGALREAGIADIAIVTGYRRDMLSPYGLMEFHNPRWAETNMVTSLACATEWLATGPVIVSYSDIFYEASAIRLLSACTGDLAITYDPHWERLWRQRFADPLDDAETFRLDPEGNLADIGGKPGHLSEIEGQYMGLLRFTPGSWQRRKMSGPVSIRSRATAFIVRACSGRSSPEAGCRSAPCPTKARGERSTPRQTGGCMKHRRMRMLPGLSFEARA